MKNGIKTTEFWLSIISITGMVLGAIFNLIPNETVAKLSVYIVATYTVARAIVKITPSKTDDKILDAIQQNVVKYFENVPDDAAKKN